VSETSSIQSRKAAQDRARAAFACHDDLYAALARKADGDKSAVPLPKSVRETV
jgi:hypothetical protein